MDKISSKFIWSSDCRNAYNTAIIAKKRFELRRSNKHAVARITADSYYRLFINGHWISDGPARSWPDEFKYDAIDVKPFLNCGINEIVVVARYFGVGDFHRIPQQAAILLQIDIEMVDGEKIKVMTDSSWEVAGYTPLIQNTPKISVQMEPAEWYNARCEKNIVFSSAKEVATIENGRWNNLTASEVKLLTKNPVWFEKYIGGQIVERISQLYCLSPQRLVFPDVIEANRQVFAAYCIATMIIVQEETTVRLSRISPSGNVIFYIDGQMNSESTHTLSKGEHILLGCANGYAHDKEVQFGIEASSAIKFKNPLIANDNPWCFVPFKEYSFMHNDLCWEWTLDIHTLDKMKLANWSKFVQQELSRVCNLEQLKGKLRSRATVIPTDKMFLLDSYCGFIGRKIIDSADKYITNPEGIMRGANGETVIMPGSQCDVELVYDLGTQHIGYFNFEVDAPEGTILDIYMVENIEGIDKVQHTLSNRNGMRYITKEGTQKYTSLKRRSGRYVFIMIRNQQSKVTLKEFSLISAIYPISQNGHFNCSNSELNQIWNISERTLKLCTEDTFTDCPLYEQTLWVGDARNESLFAYTVFGNTEVARNCIELAAKSLDKYPMVLCQVPTCWEAIIPVWSFLWTISVWEYYWYTGDLEFLKKMWPQIKKNLKNAESYVDSDGLFSAPFWNLFDWANLDHSHKKVLHNSMFMVGAINAALESASVLKNDSTEWLKSLKDRIINGINTCWDSRLMSYIDSIHDDGVRSQSISQHTNFLSILYKVADKSKMDLILENVFNPPERMVTVGSPFAIMFLYEMLDLIGEPDKIIKSIIKHYSTMLEYGATTVWESFEEGTLKNNGFPTRSHCHAWSSTPLYFLPRIILGIRQTKAGGKAYDLSPWIQDLDWAEGSIISIYGPIRISWQKRQKYVSIKFDAPPNVQIKFVSNPSLAGRQIILNGRRLGAQPIISSTCGKQTKLNIGANPKIGSTY